MTTVELAAVVVVVVCMMTVVVLVLAAVSLVRTLRDLRSLVADLRGRALPLMDDLRNTADRAEVELGKVDEVVDRVEKISHKVDNISQIAYRAFAPPLIKSVSLVSGFGRATKRLSSQRRSRREATPSG